MQDFHAYAVPPPGSPGIAGLVAAARKNRTRESLGTLVQAATWDALASLLQPRFLASQDALITQGARDRSLYFIESGMVRVFRRDGATRVQLAVVGPGSVVGDGTFFAPVARNASVQAVEPTALWELTQEQFSVLTAGSPAQALNLALAVGTVLSTRIFHVTGRLSIT